MDKRTLKRLEFPKLLDKLAGYARSAPGKEMALNLKPVFDLKSIKKLQDETTEGKNMYRFEPGADMHGWFDIRAAVLRAVQGSVIEPQELYRVGQTLASSRRIKRFILDRQERYPLMARLVFNIESFVDLEKDILKSVLPSGEILDEASPALFQIRKRLTKLQQEIKDQLERIIRSPQYIKYLQEPIVTIRENRYVIPVKQEYRSNVPGIVHDQSASGATLFMEPMQIVESNNEIRRLNTAEKQEIFKILSGFSSRIAGISESLGNIVKILGYIDFIMAKASLSIELDAAKPLISEGAYLDIKKARHPLLTGGVVPIDIRIGKDFNMLVITGPNTGGKTVALKTVGLLVLMAQAGLHIPVESGTDIGIFKQVFADIGDEQSIEQSLSTFSAHMKNIVEIIDKACPESLVLLDELGAGTDPAEGSALARAILEELNSFGTRVVATTHYTELKNYAYSTKGVENASVQFDPKSLRPTYQLLIGKPGYSNAFEIANRLGVSDSVVKRAKEFLTAEQVKITELIQKLEREYCEAEEKNIKAEEALRQAKRSKEKYEKLEQELRTSRDKIVQEAREKAQKIIKEAGNKTEEIISQLRKEIAASENRAREDAIRLAREQIKGLKNKVSFREQKKHFVDAEALQTIIPGQRVYIPNLNQHGLILKKTRDGEALVQVGIMKISLPLHELRIAEDKNEGTGKTTIAGIMASKSENISMELDLRGKYADEAVSAVEKYLDDVCLAGLKRVVLIHGKGTGALRTAIHGFLRKNPSVHSFRLGMQEEGGLGVTVVELNG